MMFSRSFLLFLAFIVVAFGGAFYYNQDNQVRVSVLAFLMFLVFIRLVYLGWKELKNPED